MAGLSLRCGDCGAQLRSVEEAQAHAEATNHANFVESTEAVLNLVCSDCGKPCRSQTVRSHPPPFPSLALPEFPVGFWCLVPRRFNPVRVAGLSVRFRSRMGSMMLTDSAGCAQEVDLHTKRTGHTEFADKTAEVAKPIDLEAPLKPASEDAMDVDASASASGEPQGLVVVSIVSAS